MKNWNILGSISNNQYGVDDIIGVLLKNRGITKASQKDAFLHPKDPTELTPIDVGISRGELKRAFGRIQKAIKGKESIVVYTDYDADGITAGAVLWEALYELGARVMPYVPHRVDEGYGLSEKGIDRVQKEYDPTLIITVDHGITAVAQVEYAKKHGIDVVVTDHHVKPKKYPDCPLIHTTDLSGAGVSWFVSHMLLTKNKEKARDLLALCAIGTIADMVPLVGANRSIVVYGLKALKVTKRLGIVALLKDAGIVQSAMTTSDVSHILAPRINAMGRLEHALDALRLLCTKSTDRATRLAQVLSLTNKDRQQLTIDTTMHAIGLYKKKDEKTIPNILVVSDASYNQGVIGLVAGKLVETYYRPAIVIAKGEIISKASVRSIRGFDIISFLRNHSSLLVDVGGHPMAAGFTIETKNIRKFAKEVEEAAKHDIKKSLLVQSMSIDLEIPMTAIRPSLHERIADFAPFGLGNPEPIFASTQVTVDAVRLIGAKQNHLKLKLSHPSVKTPYDAVGFGLGEWYGKMKQGMTIDVAYTIDMNQWNGTTGLQLKIRDIQV
jgi:single-stranded-DNA-specific exonuclease